MIDYNEQLNSEQLDAVLHGDGPCLVLAGAGSGKTRVITYRVAYLLEQGIDPQNILLVTFTNKAADEMIGRVQKLTGSQGRLPWAGTFHHIAYKILRQYAPLLKNCHPEQSEGSLSIHQLDRDSSHSFGMTGGYGSNFTVLDSDDSETLLKLCAKNFKTDGEKQKACLPAGRFPSAKVLQAIISYARNSETTIYDVLELKYPQWLSFFEQIKSAAEEYGAKKKEANVMDFDDLLVNFLALLNNEGVLKKYAQQFKYILVDEYQDTNKIQASIIKKLASVHKNLLVVGDDAQSIYSFRAADVRNILQFEKDYPDAKIFKLETNYRSSHEILRLANEVIANNTKQYKKELRSLEAVGLKPTLHPQMDQSAEAEFVAQKILDLVKNGTSETEIAVLFRAAHHSQILEMELVKAGIAYDYRGGLRFFERAHVKDVLAYLRILNNFADTAAWMRVLMHEEGIGPGAAGKIVGALKNATQNVVIPSEAIADEGSLSNNRPTEISHFIRNDIPALLGEKAKNGWYNFVRIWEAMLGNSKTDAAALIEAIVNSPYKDYLETEFIDSKDRLEDIVQLQVFAKKYNELEQFLAEASLQESFNIKNNQHKDHASPKVVLSTIHQAKGLEWSAVFIINLSSGAFPHERALREENGLEEERRLFYVAITRAKKYLYLTYPMSGGGWGDSLSGPSIFLGEIGSDLLDDHSLLSGSGGNGLVLDDEEAGVAYEAENPGTRVARATRYGAGNPLRIIPGSFLRSVEDL